VRTLQIRERPGRTTRASAPDEVVHRPRRSREGLLLVVLVVVGAVIRVVPLRSVWLDEAISIAQARMPYGAMIHQLAVGDLHPPLWATVLWLDVRLFGYGPLAIRIPSIILGTLCIPLIYLLARELYDKRAGMVAALLITICPLAVWYSGEARMYGLYLFWSIVAMLGQAWAIRRGQRRGWVLFVMGSVGLLYTQYFTAFQLCAQHLVFLALVIHQRLRNRRLRDRTAPTLLVPWLLSALATVVLFLPLLPYLMTQLGQFTGPGAAPQTAAETGQPVSLYVVMANLMWGMYGYHSDAAMTQLVALWPAGMLLVLVLLGRGRSWQAMLLTSAVAVPVGCAYVMSSQARTYFEVRYFISVVPALLVLVARAASGWLPGTRARAVAAGVISLTLVAGLVDQQLNPANPRQYDYPGAFRLVDAEARPGDLILYAPSQLEPVFRYYRPGSPATPVLNGVPVQTPRRGRIVLVASFLDQPDTADLVGRTLTDLEQGGRPVQRTAHLENVTIWILG
jgi:uncharacterized membrane protein